MVPDGIKRSDDDRGSRKGVDSARRGRTQDRGKVAVAALAFQLDAEVALQLAGQLAGRVAAPRVSIPAGGAVGNSAGALGAFREPPPARGSE